MDDLFRRNDNAMRPTSNPVYQQPGYDASQQQPSQQNDRPSMHDPQRGGIGGSRTLGSNVSSTGYGGYYQAPSTGAFTAGDTHSGMNYHQPAGEYGQHTRQAHGFAGVYGPPSSGMMYGVQQSGPQGTVFGVQQPFAPRHHGNVQMIPPEVSSAPYISNDPIPMHVQTGHPSPSSTLYQPHQDPSNRQGVFPGYPSTVGAAPATAVLASHVAAGTNLEQQISPAATIDASSRDYAEASEEFSSYRRTLKRVFGDIKSGSLVLAAEALLNISGWLLSRVESLGLTIDDEEQYESRLKLWQNFNNAWLALFEKQKELMWPGTTVLHRQSLIPLEYIEKMARELVRLCDGIERFGLVDYDYGVWEERIMSILTECIDLHNMEEEGNFTGIGTSSSQQD